MPMATPEAQRQYQREWVARRRAEWFADKVCVRCGADEDLQLDHLDPGQKVTHKIWSWSAARREAEIAKCQVLCEPCHKAKTAEDFNFYQHGRPNTYNRGCRCAVCTEAHRDRVRRYRSTRGESRTRTPSGTGV